IKNMFDPKFDPKSVAFVENSSLTESNNNQRHYSVGSVRNIIYHENTVAFDISNAGDGFLLLTDNYYLSWHATIDGVETPIYLTDYTFRGIAIPKGRHKVVFYDTLF